MILPGTFIDIGAGIFHCVGITKRREVFVWSASKSDVGEPFYQKLDGLCYAERVYTYSHSELSVFRTIKGLLHSRLLIIGEFYAHGNDNALVTQNGNQDHITKLNGVDGACDLIVTLKGLFFFVDWHKMTVSRVKSFSDIDFM